MRKYNEKNTIQKTFVYFVEQRGEIIIYKKITIKKYNNKTNINN